MSWGGGTLHKINGQILNQESIMLFHLVLIHPIFSQLGIPPKPLQIHFKMIKFLNLLTVSQVDKERNPHDMIEVELF